ncbi:MAG: hypothetical protein WAK55_06470 [Xanthobacteraceae bacterium]
MEVIESHGVRISILGFGTMTLIEPTQPEITNPWPFLWLLATQWQELGRREEVLA